MVTSWLDRTFSSIDPDEVCKLALDLCRISSPTGEEELARLVTIDSLIGAGEPLHPSQLKEIKVTKQVRVYD